MTLKNNAQLWDGINCTKVTKQLQNNQTNIEHKTACLSQLTNRGRRCCSNRKNLFSPHYIQGNQEVKNSCLENISTYIFINSLIYDSNL